MATHTTLVAYLDNWADTDTRKSVVETINALVGAGRTISSLVALGPLAGKVGEVIGEHEDGDSQKALDLRTNDIVVDALNAAPVSFIASEEMDDAIATAKPDTPLIVAMDPLDGSSNIETNVSIGTIFSILPKIDGETEPNAQFYQTGRNQLAGGYIVYGPQLSLVMTVGDGTHIFTCDPVDGQFKMTSENIQIPKDTREFAINMSNYRHWDEPVQRYINDILEGADGPRNKNFNTRWIGAMVAECFRVLIRGGIYIYGNDVREGYEHGRLRLIYEGNPVAFLIEQAGGAATTGNTLILDVTPTAIHQRIPLIFGSANEVNILEEYIADTNPAKQDSPLFGKRGLFRA
jgi:fructose-1,6-bisphosphatase I